MDIKKIVNFGRIGISLLLIIGLLYVVGLDNFVDAILKFDILFVPIVFFLMLVTLVLSGFNLKILFDAKSKIEPKEFFKDFCSSWAAGFIMPGKIGDFYLGYLLRKQVSVGFSSAVILLDKLITLLIISVLGILSLLLFLEQKTAIPIIAVLLLMWIAGIILLFSPLGRKLLANKIIPEKYKYAIEGFFDTLKYFLKSEKRRILLNFILTLVKITIQGFTFILIFEGLGVSAPLFEIILITSAITIISFVPITTGGLGVKEAAFALFAVKIGLPLNASVTNTIISTAANYIIVGILAFIFLDRNIKNIKN